MVVIVGATSDYAFEAISMSRPGGWHNKQKPQELRVSEATAILYGDIEFNDGLCILSGNNPFALILGLAQNNIVQYAP